LELSNMGALNLNDLRNVALPTNSAPFSANNAASSGNFSQMLQRMSLSQGDTGDNSTGRRVVADDIDRNSELFQLTLELETFLVKNLLNAMRSTIQRSDLIDQGFAGQIYEDMLFDEHARSLTRNAGFGLAEAAYRQLRNMDAS